jgi:AraC-like DNA-binding protein
MINLSFNIYTLLISLSVVIAITFGFLLVFSSHATKRADRFLAAVVFTVAFWNSSLLILELDIYQFMIGIIWIPFTYTLALGPCLYFYVKYLTITDLTLKQKIWPHFIPMLIQVGLFLVQVFIAIPQAKGYFQTQLFKVVDPIVNVLAILSLLIYGCFTRAHIFKYHQWVQENYSHYHRYQLNWLIRLSSVFLLLMVVWLVYLLVDYVMFDYQLTFKHYYPFHLGLAVISIWLSVEAYIKPDIIYSDTDLKIVEQTDDQLEPDKELQEQALWLKNQIEKNRLYLDPELSLKSLASTLDMHPNVTSRIINEGLGVTFSDCINEYRVNAVKQRLSDPSYENDTFLAIAFDCGFNSKTTFNRIFKKYCSKTPIQFRKSLKNP